MLALLEISIPRPGGGYLSGDVPNRASVNVQKNGFPATEKGGKLMNEKYGAYVLEGWVHLLRLLIYI